MSTRLYNPGVKPPTGTYKVVGPLGGETKHGNILVKVRNVAESKLPPTPKPNQKYARYCNIENKTI